MESINFESLLKSVLDHLRTVAKTETVIGEQFTLGEYVCAPVIRLGMGFGSGGGLGESHKEGKGRGGGVGGGIGVEPVAFIVSRGDQIQILNVNKSSSSGKAFESLIEKAPDLMDKFADMKKKFEEKKED